MAFTKPLVKAAGTALQTGAEKVLRNLPIEQADFIAKTFNFKPGSPQDTFVRMGGIHPTDGPGIINSIQRGEAQDLPQHITNAVGGERGAFNEIARFSDNGTNQATEDTIKANGLSNAQPKTAEPANINPTRYEIDSAGKPGAEADLQRWFDQELKQAGGDSSKIDRSQFATEGVFIDGQRQGIKGLSKGKPKFYSLGPMEERAFQLNPDNHPAIKDVFDRGHAEGVIPPEVNFEGFKKEATYTANLADRLTSRLSKMWGLDSPTKGVLGSFPENMKIGGRKAYVAAADKIDKGHMISAKTKASDMGMSQVPENALGNRRMGKLNAFSKRVMETLDLPGGGGSGKLASGKTPKSEVVKKKLAQRDQQGWLKAATDYIANRKVDPETGEIIFTESRDVVLTPADKLRIQRKLGSTADVNKKGLFRIPISGQEQAAQQVMAEKRVIEAFFEAGLGGRPDEMKALKEILSEISADEQVLKAQYISEEGQIARAAQDNPMARLEDLQAQTEETYGVTVQKGKTARKVTRGHSPKTKVTKLDRKGNVIKSEEDAINKYINAKKRELKEVSPGVAVNENYNPGRDPAVDALLQKLARDGADSLDSSGFGGSVGGDMQRIVND